MYKLRTLLLSNYLYLIILTISILLTIIRLMYFPFKSSLNETITNFKGIIEKINIDGNNLKIIIKAKEKIVGYYYFESQESLTDFKSTYQVGDMIEVVGSLEKIAKNTIPYIYNNQKYSAINNTFYNIKITKYKLLNKNTNLIINARNVITNYFLQNKSSFAYLETFLLGNDDNLNQDVKLAYQGLGISHLLAISGTHITVFCGILLFIFKRLKISENKRYLLVIIFLTLYIHLTGFFPSILRAYIFFILITINKIYYFNIKTLNLFFLTFSLSLLYNPYFIYNLGFQFSFIISFYLIAFQKYLNSKKYFLGLLLTSIISFIASVPICLTNFYQINLFTIIYNLFYIPYISIIVFPLTIITAFFPLFDQVLAFFIYILEQSVLLLNKLNIVKIILFKPNELLIILYYLVGTLALINFFNRKKKFIILYVILIIFNYHYYEKNNYLLMFDIGQGDSILLHNNQTNILIDTGGKIQYNEELWQKKVNNYSLVTAKTIPYLKSRGIRKINLLILTHGDADHLGEAINLVNNFKVESVVFNTGNYNSLEKELIKVLIRKNIKYYNDIKSINLNKYNLYFLNTKDYNNENDNSSVIYTKINNIKLLFMGDAGVKREKDIIKKYQLNNIDILKVGHHGSDTSSSQYFISSINPRVCLISVGLNNYFGHPKEDVLNALWACNIYRTDLNGSIKIIFNSNKYIIKTYSR